MASTVAEAATSIDQAGSVLSNAELGIVRTGRLATFDNGIIECTRILNCREDYYGILKVTDKSSQTEIRYNYLGLSSLVHPESCDDSLADAAHAIVTKAFNTLNNPWKRALYDQFVTDTGISGMTYEEFESLQKTEAEVKLPRWVNFLLGCPCGPLVGFIVFIPVTLVLIVVLGALHIVFLPFKITWEAFKSCGKCLMGSNKAPGVERDAQGVEQRARSMDNVNGVRGPHTEEEVVDSRLRSEGSEGQAATPVSVDFDSGLEISNTGSIAMCKHEQNECNSVDVVGQG